MTLMATEKFAKALNDLLYGYCVEHFLLFHIRCIFFLNIDVYIGFAGGSNFFDYSNFHFLIYNIRENGISLLLN